VTGDRTTPTPIPAVAIKELIRGQLGFDGPEVTDAPDMGGFGGAAARASPRGRSRPSPLWAGSLDVMEALSAALFGEGSFPGRLPAAVPGMYPVGHAWGADSE
jgi:hypothetical protein